MNAEETKIVLAQLKDHGRVQRWFGLGARAEELFDTFDGYHANGSCCSRS